MKKAGFVTALVLGATLVGAIPGWAQFQRYDYVWARRTTDTITMDGQLNEAAWAQADSLIIDIHQTGPIPGSGWKQEAGFPPTDPNHAVFRFLSTADNQLWLGVTVRDSSIGGSEIFNYFDGLLMSVKQHQQAARPAPAGEHFISWWWPTESGDTHPRAINKPMSMVGVWRTWPPGSTVSPEQQLAWDAAYSVNGSVNSDTTSDGRYTIEMRFDLASDGYDYNQVGGDAVEWNCSLYDDDWYWPMSNPFRWAVNRTWMQGPWGNTGWYSNVKVLGNTTVTTTSGPAPAYTPDLNIPVASGYAAPTIDGSLSEAVWAAAPSVHIKWGDPSVRDAYPQTGKWRSGQAQGTVNQLNDQFVADPTDATVKYFWKGTKLYLGFDVPDQVVQYSEFVDRYDGALVSINDRVRRYTDNDLYSYRLTFQVGESGQLVARDALPYAADTLGGVTASLQLKPGSTVDTLGLDTDAGWTAEMAIDLTKFGYAADLGDHTIYFGIDILDGDSYTPWTDSYGTRTWFFRQFENEDGPCVAFLDPRNALYVGVDQPVTAPSRLELLGNFPNPFKGGTSVRFRLPEASKVSIDVFDLAGRLVSSRAYGVMPAGEGHLTVPKFASHSGVYLYKMRVVDPNSGADRGTLSGKMMVIE